MNTMLSYCFHRPGVYGRAFLIILFVSGLSRLSWGQTDVSLFWKEDGKQRSEVTSAEADQYRKIGHHGPAVENRYMALRLYYNNSGAVDVYSKTGKQLELAEFKWYTTEADQARGYGCDEYRVGSTVGLGGINLWDGEKVVKLVATRGRDARVGKTKQGAFAEMLSKGIPYKGDTVDILVRIEMFNDARYARVKAFCVSGQKVEFVTGVNYHPGQQVEYGDGYMAVWGIHPADVSQHPIPIGGGMRYRVKDFAKREQTKDMIQLISKPAKKLETYVTSASVREKEINTPQLFLAHVKELKVK